MPPPNGDADAVVPPRVTLARLVRPRGLRGEVVAEVLTDFPERLTQLRAVLLARDPAEAAPTIKKVQRCWLHKGGVVFQFEGVDSMDAAERLRGLYVQVPLSERVELPAGKYFVSDLVGCEVFEVKDVEEAEEVKEKTPFEHGLSSTTSTSLAHSTFASLGCVRDVLSETGTPVLAVDSPRGELLIPLAEDICKRIDVAARRIEVVLPDGLLDLNP